MQGSGAASSICFSPWGSSFNEEMGYAFISVKHLAFLLGVDRSTITRALSVLVNEEALVARSLRKGSWTISRKTEILWDKLHARRVEFESTSKGPDGRIAKETATSTLETDITTVSMLDEPLPQPSVRSEEVVVKELLRLCSKVVSPITPPSRGMNQNESCPSASKNVFKKVGRRSSVLLSSGGSVRIYSMMLYAAVSITASASAATSNLVSRDGLKGSRQRTK